MQAVKSLGMADANLDMFGFDSSAMRQAEAMARIANRRQRQLSEQLAAVQGAAKRPEQARKLGVDVADPDAVRAKIAEIKQERDAWETWSTNPDLVAQIRQEAEAQTPRASAATGTAANPAETVRALAAHPEVQRLGDRIAVVERQTELRPELQPKDGGAVKAVIDGDRIVLVGEHWTPEDLARMEGVLQHEGGVHLARDSGFYDPQVQAAGKLLRAVGLKALAGDASWTDVTRQFQALVRNGHRTAQRAHELARTALGQDADAHPDRLAEEAFGYLAELNPQHSLIRRLAATVKAVLYRMGVKVTLGDAELVALARLGLRQQAKATTAGIARGNTGLAPATESRSERFSRPDPPYASTELPADKNDAHAFRMAALAVVQKRYAGKPPVQVTVESTGEPVMVAFTGVKHALRAVRPSWQTSLAALHVEDLLRRAEKISVEPDRYGRKDPVAIHLYRTQGKFDGVTHDVILIVREHSDGRRYYDHAVLEERASAGLPESQQPKPTDLLGLNAEAKNSIPPIDQNRYSRALNWTDDLSPEVRSMAEKIGAEPKGWRERLAEMRSTLPTRLRAGLVDRYARLLELDRQRFGRDAADTHADVSAWVAAKMSRSAEGALEALFLHGRLYWDGGALNVRETRNGLAKALEPVAQAGELNRFWQWIIAHRSQRLMSEGRERLFTAAEIAAGLTLNNGTMADGKSRDAAYRQAFARYRSLQKSVLDVAEHSGLFDAAQRAQWEHDFYLPFYRVIDDAGAVRGPTSGGQMVRQKAFEKLKGGAEPLGDPLQNILRNWHHLIDAGLKNRAATLALETASHLGVAEKIHEAQADKHSVWVMQVGQKTHYSVRDPLTLEAVSALTAPALNSTLLTLFGGFKRALTLGATISPAFKARNLLRDSLNVLAVSGISRNVPNNVIQGYRAAQEGTATQAALLAGGGTFRFGSLREGDPHAAARAIAGWQPDTVLDSRQKIAGLIETLKKGFDAWQRFGDRLETANRAALYEQLRKAGKTHLQAALAARDTLDFAQSGAWPATRMLITMVPFLNARIQGLDVLYRQGVKPLARRLVGKASAGEKQQALRFAATTAAIALASIVLYLIYRDDEDFKAREQWDRDAYWWFKIGDAPWRYPKPFEVGALGTVAERLVEQIVDQEATGKLFAERLKHLLLQTFHFDPTPQALQPLLEVYANRDSFTRRPIENLAMEQLSPELRSGPNTSAVGVGLSRAGLGTLGVSPVQIDHLVNGYLGWLGAQALSLGDRIARPLAQMPERPDRGVRDLPLIGDFIQSFAPDGRSNRYTTEFYEKLKTTRQAAADLHLYERLGDAAGVRRQVAMQRRELAQSGAMEAGARLFSQLGQAERRIAHDPTLSGTEKQARIDALRRRQTAMAQRLIAALP